MLFSHNPIVQSVGGGGASYYSELTSLSPDAYWRLGESSGTAAVDDSGLKDGVYVNTPTLGVTGALPGSSDTAITLAASSSEYVSVADATEWDSKTVTILAWFKTTASGITGNIVRRDGGGGGTRTFLLRVNTSNELEALLIFGGNPSVVSSASVNDGNWHFAALVYEENGSNTDMELFLDGSSEGTNTATALSPASSEQLFIGTQRGLSEFFDGSIDEVSFLSKALTPTEIQTLYDAAPNSE